MLKIDEGRGKKGSARHLPSEDDVFGDDQPTKSKLPKLKINRDRKLKFALRQDESQDEDVLVVEHDDFGIGSILDRDDIRAEVMFEHGIEIVDIDTLTEARGRPPKQDDDPDGEANRNIITQLHKVSNGTSTHVKFNDGSKHPISSSHARAALDKHSDIA
jgi:hypothetical protein